MLRSFRSSSTVVTIGNISRTVPCGNSLAARTIARICVLKNSGCSKRQPNAAPAHERIGFLMIVTQVGDRFVATDIKRPDRHVVIGTGGNDLTIGFVLFVFVGNIGVCQIQVFGSIKPDSRGAHRTGGLGVGDAVDVCLQSQFDVVRRDGGQVTIGRQLVLEVKELAFEFSKCRQRFGVRIDFDMTIATVDDDRVARFDSPDDSCDAGDGRNAARSGDDRRVTGLASFLGHDSVDVDVAERDDLGRQQFVGDHDQRPLDRGLSGSENVGQMAAQSNDHVANVVQSFLQVLVVGFVKKRRCIRPAADAARRRLSFGRRRSSCESCW